MAFASRFLSAVTRMWHQIKGGSTGDGVSRERMKLAVGLFHDLKTSQAVLSDLYEVGIKSSETGLLRFVPSYAAADPADAEELGEDGAPMSMLLADRLRDRMRASVAHGSVERCRLAGGELIAAGPAARFCAMSRRRAGESPTAVALGTTILESTGIPATDASRFATSVANGGAVLILVRAGADVARQAEIVMRLHGAGDFNDAEYENLPASVFRSTAADGGAGAAALQIPPAEQREQWTQAAEAVATKTFVPDGDGAALADPPPPRPRRGSFASKRPRRAIVIPAPDGLEPETIAAGESSNRKYRRKAGERRGKAGGERRGSAEAKTNPLIQPNPGSSKANAVVAKNGSKPFPGKPPQKAGKPAASKHGKKKFLKPARPLRPANGTQTPTKNPVAGGQPNPRGSRD